MLNVQAIAITLDYLIMSIFVKYNTNQEIIIAFIDLTVEKAKTGNATPGRVQTVKILTGFSIISGS